MRVAWVAYQADAPFDRAYVFAEGEGCMRAVRSYLDDGTPRYGEAVPVEDMPDLATCGHAKRIEPPVEVSGQIFVWSTASVLLAEQIRARLGPAIKHWEPTPDGGGLFLVDESNVDLHTVFHSLYCRMWLHADRLLRAGHPDQGLVRAAAELYARIDFDEALLDLVRRAVKRG